MGKKRRRVVADENGTEQQIGRKGKFDSIRTSGKSISYSEDLDLFVQQNRIGEIITMGSALKYCRLAKGDVELSPRLVGSSEWDTAAAQVVLEATGGLMIDWHTKQSLIYGKEKWYNPRFLAMGIFIKPRSLFLKITREFHQRLMLTAGMRRKMDQRSQKNKMLNRFEIISILKESKIMAFAISSSSSFEWIKMMLSEKPYNPVRVLIGQTNVEDNA